MKKYLVCVERNDLGKIWKVDEKMFYLEEGNEEVVLTVTSIEE